MVFSRARKGKKYKLSKSTEFPLSFFSIWSISNQDSVQYHNNMSISCFSYQICYLERSTGIYSSSCTVKNVNCDIRQNFTGSFNNSYSERLSWKHFIKIVHLELAWHEHWRQWVTNHCLNLIFRWTISPLRSSPNFLPAYCSRTFSLMGSARTSTYLPSTILKSLSP